MKSYCIRGVLLDKVFDVMVINISPFVKICFSSALGQSLVVAVNIFSSVRGHSVRTQILPKN